jgi:hypothetical protein
MAKRALLDDLIDGIDMQSSDVTAYFDCETGEVVAIGDEIVSLSERDETAEWRDWERELIEVQREVEKGSKRYLQLPSTWDVHEWDMMRRFSETVGDDRLKEQLLQQIHARGAFRRFKDQLNRTGLLQRWFAFKRDVLREHAIAWCRENDIPFE